VAFLRFILFPFSILYGIILLIRNKLFDWEILKSKSFDLPIVSVGNLNVGGIGKTPHIEYLANLLKQNYKIAILSRGYKRKTKGFVLADNESNYNSIGDEPFLYKTKYKDVYVAVDEKRVRGVNKLKQETEQLDVVLLDDAFQHRWIKPGISILLTDFYQLYSNDYVLPTGNLREFRSGAIRADIIVVTKSPKVLSPITRRRATELIKPKKHQTLYFSYVRHGKLSQIPGVDYVPEKTCRFSTILMVSGIANPYPFERYLAERCTTLEKIVFPDHHDYKDKDIDQIIQKFKTIFTKNKVIITTEKDIIRLIHPGILEQIKNLPICYIPIEVRFHRDDTEAFDKQIVTYVGSNKTNDRIH